MAAARALRRAVRVREITRLPQWQRFEFGFETKGEGGRVFVAPCGGAWHGLCIWGHLGLRMSSIAWRDQRSAAQLLRLSLCHSRAAPRPLAQMCAGTRGCHCAAVAAARASALLLRRPRSARRSHCCAQPSAAALRTDCHTL